MTSLFFADALLPAGWAKDVRIEVDDAGNIAAVESNAKAGRDCERAAGPALPGMPNLHSHAFQRAMAGLAEMKGAGADDDFWTWRELMYKFVERLTPERAQAVATHLYVDMLKHGYTAVGEFHYVNDRSSEMLARHAAAAEAAGIAITLLPSLYRWGGFGQKPLQSRQRRFASDPRFVLDLVKEIRTTPDLHAGVSPHSLRAADPASLKELVAGAKGPIHVHAAEQAREVDECLAALGKRPVEWILENFAIDARWCLVHATHMTPEETAALAKSGATAGLCPTTEANLGDGLFPLAAYRAAGGRYGIGGDSHVSRDPAEELRLLEYGQRLAARRRNIAAGPATPAVGTTLWLEACAGAAALGRKMGALAPGMRADLVVLDADHPDLAGRSGDALANALVFSGSTNLVRDVMVAGDWKVRDRRHLLEEPAAAAYKRAVAELLRSPT
jgi:formimidoylglutamate deiminase